MYAGRHLQGGSCCLPQCGAVWRLLAIDCLLPPLREKECGGGRVAMMEAVVRESDGTEARCLPEDGCQNACVQCGNLM